MAFRKWIIKDWGWKLFSLALAVIIWATTHKAHDKPEAFSGFATVTTLTFSNLPVAAFSASGGGPHAQLVPDAVAVKVSGPPEGMAALQQQNQIHATVNLTGIDAATGLKRAVDVALPPGLGLTLVDVDPREIIVNLPPQKPATNEMQIHQRSVR